MRKIFLLLAIVGMVWAVDVKETKTTPVKTYTTFNERVGDIAGAPYEAFYNNSILPVSGRLQIPATFKGQMLGSSKFTSYNNSSTDTLEFLGGDWKFSDGCFGDSLTVLFASGAVSEVMVSWFGETETAINRAINSLPYYSGVPIKFKDAATYNITSTNGLNLTQKDGVELQFRNSTLKRTSGNGPVLTLQGCTHVQLKNLYIDGGSRASIGLNLQSNQASGGQGSSFNKVQDLYVAYCTTAVKIGQYDVDGRNDAFDRATFTDVRLSQYKYGVWVNSANALDLVFNGKTNFRVNTDIGGIAVNNKRHIKMDRGGAEFLDVYTGGNAGANFWCWDIKDAHVRVHSWYNESGAFSGGGNCGMILMRPESKIYTDSFPTTRFKSVFDKSQIKFVGQDITDTFVNGYSGVAIVMQDSSRELVLNDCNLYKNTVAERSVRIGKSCSFVSKGCTYTCATIPWAGLKNNQPLGKITSIGDRLTDYTNFTELPMRSYNTGTSFPNALELYSTDTTGATNKGRAIEWFSRVDTTTTHQEMGMIKTYKNNAIVGNKSSKMQFSTSDNTLGLRNTMSIDSAGRIQTNVTGGQFQSNYFGGGGFADTSYPYSRFQLQGGTANMIQWAGAGIAEPSFTTRSVGTKLLLYPLVGATNVDYAMGLGNDNDMWWTVPNTGAGYRYKWYFGETERMRLDATTGLKFIDSTKTPCIKDANGKYWRIKVSTTGVLSADSTKMN